MTKCDIFLPVEYFDILVFCFLVSSFQSHSFFFMKEKEKRKYTKKACVSCKESHLACDSNRPCVRCFSRGKVCFDAVQKKRGRPVKSGNLSVNLNTNSDFLNALTALSMFIPIDKPNKTSYGQTE